MSENQNAGDSVLDHKCQKRKEKEFERPDKKKTVILRKVYTARAGKMKPD